MPSLLVLIVVTVVTMAAGFETRRAAPGLTLIAPAEVICSLDAVVLPRRVSRAPISTTMSPAKVDWPPMTRLAMPCLVRDGVDPAKPPSAFNWLVLKIVVAVVPFAVKVPKIVLV